MPDEAVRSPAARLLERFQAKFVHICDANDGVDAARRAIAQARGHVAEMEINEFYADSPELTNPFPDIPTSDVALERIRKAMTENEKIAIIGDYDVDGVVSSVILREILMALGLRPDCFIPDRKVDDYGVTDSAMDKCIERFDPQLLISVDCGSISIDQIRRAREQGIDFIVLDHHEPGDATDDHPALAHLNPKAWKEHSAPVHEAMPLCAGGLTFFFACYLAENLLPEEQKEWSRDRALILAGLATVVDVMPLTRTNRALARLSIKLANGPHGQELVPGMVALLTVARGNQFSGSAYGWLIGPRLNAAGRVDTARLATNILSFRQIANATPAAEELHQINARRKKLQDGVQEEAIEQAKEQLKLNPDRKFLVLCQEDWHPGVVGVVAGRVRERFNLPTIVCGRHDEGDCWKGSARSVEGCHLGEIIAAACQAGVASGGGGHHAAAGVRIDAGKEEAFREWIEEHTAKMKWQTVPILETMGRLGDLTMDEWWSVLRQAEPFGQGAPVPGMTAEGVTVVGQPTRLSVKKTGRVFGVRFDIAASHGRHTISWLGLGEDEAAVAIELLVNSDSVDLGLRLTQSQSYGRTFTNLEVVSIRLN